MTHRRMTSKTTSDLIKKIFSIYSNSEKKSIEEIEFNDNLLALVGDPIFMNGHRVRDIPFGKQRDTVYSGGELRNCLVPNNCFPEEIQNEKKPYRTRNLSESYNGNFIGERLTLGIKPQKIKELKIKIGTFPKMGTKKHRVFGIEYDHILGISRIEGIKKPSGEKIKFENSIYVPTIGSGNSLGPSIRYFDEQVITVVPIQLDDKDAFLLRELVQQSAFLWTQKDQNIFFKQ